MTKTRVLGVWGLTLISVSAIVSLRNLSGMAFYGVGAFFFYSLAAIIFLIPTALVSAELATGWRQDGGVFAWTRAAFGDTAGFLAIWCAWVTSVTLFPLIISFTTTAIAYLFNPAWIENKYLMFIFTLIIFWSVTILNFTGVRISAWFSEMGTLLGTVIPGFFLVVLGIYWMMSDNPSQIQFTWQGLLPSMDLKNIVFFAGVILAFSGMEISAYYVQEANNPQKDFGRAILLASFIVIALYMLGSLAIAAIVPGSQLHLVAGPMQVFTVMAQTLHFPFIALFSKTIIVCLILGTLAQTNTWILGPAKGLLFAAETGCLPQFFKKTNQHHIPVRILVAQGVLGSLVSYLFVAMPTVSTAFWVLTALTTQTTTMIYLFIFAAFIRLRHIAPTVPRAFRVPFGKWGKWIIAGGGFTAAFLTFLLTFIPPSQIESGNVWVYEAYLIGGLLLLLSPALFFMIRRGEISFASTGSHNG